MKLRDPGLADSQYPSCISLRQTISINQGEQISQREWQGFEPPTNANYDKKIQRVYRIALIFYVLRGVTHRVDQRFPCFGDWSDTLDLAPDRVLNCPTRVVDESSSACVESRSRTPESDSTGLFKIVEVDTAPKIAKGCSREGAAQMISAVLRILQERLQGRPL